MTDYADWTDAAAIAAAIAVGDPGGAPGGVPLLNGAASIINTTLSGIAASSAQATGFNGTSQIGYECLIGLQNHSSAVAAAFAKITLDWRDSATSVVLLTESWVACTGPNGTPHTLKGRGPSGANQLRVTITNDASSADSIDATIQVWASSRIFTRSDMRSDSFQSASFTKVGGDLTQDVVASTSPAALGSGGTWTRLMPLYAGQVSLFGLTSSGTTDGEFAIEGMATVFGLANDQFVFDGFTGTKGSLFQALTLPRFQMVIVGTNHNAGTFGLSATVLLTETET